MSMFHCRNSFKRLSASLHVKEDRHAADRVGVGFQTPFGITACESQRVRAKYDAAQSFKRLSASLHVKVHLFVPKCQPLFGFQTPFGITACESKIG